MAPVGSNVKMAFFKGLEALGKGASNMASNAQQKLNEINLETRRRELLSEIPVRALDLWQKGAEMPPALGDMLKELSELDEQLTVLRAQRYAKIQEDASEAGEETAGESDSVADEAATEGENGEDAGTAAEEAFELDAQAPEAEATAFEEENPPAEESPIDEGETGDNA